MLLDNGFKIRKSGIGKSAGIYKIYNITLSKWLDVNFGHGAKNKKVPDFIKELNPALIKLFLEGLYAGDGHKSKTAHVLSTTSRQLCNDVCELILKAGDTFSFWERERPSNFTQPYTYTYEINWLTNSNEVEINQAWINRNQKGSDSVVRYEGFVYCATVPNHLLFVRRNGKGVWCGNSLRYYCISTDDIEDKWIRKAEHICRNTCEVCGTRTKVELHKIRSWLWTLCDKCHIEKRAELKLDNFE